MSIQLISRKFYTSVNNGLDFTDSSVYSTYLKANPGEKVKVVYEFKVSLQAIITSGEQFDFTVAGQCTRLLGSFLQDGFALGDTFKYYDEMNTYIFAGTILSISDTVITYTVDDLAQPAEVVTPPGARFRFNGLINGLQYRYGVITNSEADNYINKLTGLEQLYFCSLGGPAIGVYQDAVPTNYNHETGSLQCKATAADDEFTTNYELVHIFVNPYYSVDIAPFLDAETTPTDFTGSGSYKYISEISFRNYPGQINSNKLFLDNLNPGTARWFGQNVNYQAPKYSLTSIEYTDEDSAVIDTIDPTQVTHVSIVINCTENIISTLTRIVIMLSAAKIPIFLNDTETLNEKLAYSIAAGNIGATADSGVIKNVVCVVINPDEFSIDFDIDGVDTDQLTPGDKYVLGIGCGEEEVSYNATDKLMLLADYAEYQGLSGDIPDLVSFGDFQFYDYDKNFEDNNATAGTVDAVGVWNEDELALEFGFNIRVDGSTSSPELSGVEFKIMAKRGISVVGLPDEFELQSYVFPINITRVLEGGQYPVDYVNVNTQRGYNMPVASDFRRVTLTTAYNALLDPTTVAYSGFIGFKMDWQTWLYNLNANTEFYDASEPNNNLNFKASNYSDLKGFDIYGVIKVGVTTYDGLLNVIQLTEYRRFTCPIWVHDYDEDGNDPPNWVATSKKVYTEDGLTDLTGKAIQGTNMLMKITWTRVSPTAMLAADMTAVHRIEVKNSPTSDYIEIMGSDAGNLEVLFAPKTGEVGTKITKNSTTEVVTECLITGSRLALGQKYKLSGRLWAD